MVGVLAGSGQAEVGHCNESPRRIVIYLDRPSLQSQGLAPPFAAHTHQHRLARLTPRPPRCPGGRRDPAGWHDQSLRGPAKARLLTVCLRLPSPWAPERGLHVLWSGGHGLTLTHLFGLTHP